MIHTEFIKKRGPDVIFYGLDPESPIFAHWSCAGLGDFFCLEVFMKKAAYSNSFKINNSNCPLCFLYAGSDSWAARKLINTSCVLLPPNDNPSEFSWNFLNGVYVMIHVYGFMERDYMISLAFNLIKSGAKQARFFMPSEMRINYFNIPDWFIDENKEIKGNENFMESYQNQVVFYG